MKQSEDKQPEDMLNDQIQDAITTAEEIRTAIGAMDRVRGRHMSVVITKLEEALLWSKAKPSGILTTSNTIG